MSSYTNILNSTSKKFNRKVKNSRFDTHFFYDVTCFYDKSLFNLGKCCMCMETDYALNSHRNGWKLRTKCHADEAVGKIYIIM